MIRKPDKALAWQSKTILLLVVPWTVASVILQAHWWATQVPVVAWTTLGISGIFGLIVWWLKAGTPAAAATGAAITASLMFSSAEYPYEWSWLYGELPPLLTMFLLTYAATKVGRAKKERLGTAEEKQGRNAAQVTANLGAAVLFALPGTLTSLPNWVGGSFKLSAPLLFLLAPMVALAALAEAAADTVSSEIGQVAGKRPRLLTTLRHVEPGTDGGITLIGTMAGIIAAIIVAAVGTLAFQQGAIGLQSKAMFVMTASSGVFGLLFDSLLGATLERKGWLNNDAVNFLSTLSAVVLVIAELAIFGFPIKG